VGKLLLVRYGGGELGYFLASSTFSQANLCRCFWISMGLCKLCRMAGGLLIKEVKIRFSEIGTAWVKLDKCRRGGGAVSEEVP